MTKSFPASAGIALFGAVLALAGCGGGSSNSPTTPLVTPPPITPPPPPAPPVVVVDPQYLASALSPFAAGCDGVAAAGVLYVNAEVEPYLAINPQNTHNLAAVWQQDRWSSGGARGIVSGLSLDGGVTWNQHAMPFTRCGGGTIANGGDYARASNAWMSFAPDGAAYQLALAFDGQALAAGSVSAVLASRSGDGGKTWGANVTLIRDVATAFNDKPAILADPTNAKFVYAVWDRLTTSNFGPSYFTRSSDSGASWETARPIYDPGLNNQTIANVVVVLPNGTLVNLYTEIDTATNGITTTFLALIRSTDNGVTWSTPIKVADMFSVGTRDPDTGTAIRDSSLVAEIAVGPGGSLNVVWQDSRFSNGARDGIAISRSIDGGFTWSAPTRINSVATTPAFSPFVHVRGDGMIGVTYYDFRSNTTDRATLFTDYWLARSSDGMTWQENQIASPFDLALAPVTTSPGTGGFFLGDYQGLASVGTLFVPLFAQTNSGNTNNRTDIFAAPTISVTSGAAAMTSRSEVSNTTSSVTSMQITPELQQRVHENTLRVMQHRVPGWHGNAQSQSAPQQ
ncbi:sialidase family protein [Pseudolysobacter antarcticus]|uniref:sialidase family protein n=1 Tax=Pseudolysobacter antarcticus TaxID=2511995 RepID=UPI001A9311A9|nr:sialidase family protein [Pseudolysobacter antarcticus]